MDSQMLRSLYTILIYVIAMGDDEQYDDACKEVRLRGSWARDCIKIVVWH